MAIDINYFLKINNAFMSNSKKETELFERKREFERTISNLHDYETDTQVNGKNQALIVLQTKDYSEYKILSPEPFNPGDVVDCFGKKWLISEMIADTRTHFCAIMKQCNSVVNFLDFDRKPTSSPCIITPTSGVGVDKNNMISEGDARITVKLPYNKQTALLDRDMRLLFDFGTQLPKAYTITSQVCLDGIVTLVLVECELSINDNKELLIADYYGNVSPIPISGDCLITYKGSNEIKAGGLHKVFTAVFKDSNGAVLTDKTPVWNLITNPIYSDKFTIIESGLDIKIKAENDKNLLGEVIKLELTDTESAYKTQIDIKVVSLT